MAELISAIVRDTELEQRMLEAVIADRNSQPRSQQLQAGPSSIGFCRELLRATLFEPESVAEPETNWATAAHVGSVMGDDLERIFGERIDALTQQRVTALFQHLGLQISGAIDLLFIDRNQVSDLKSAEDMGSVLYDLEKNASIIDTLLEIWREGALYAKHIETPDGGYELTEVMLSKLAKLHYYVQVAIYVVGALQSGALTDGAEARLVFYDRSGSFQEFVALVITNEQLQMFFDIAQYRIQQVVAAQEAYEGTGGNPAVIAHLRDQSPSFCFSPKVMCQRRMHCWGGSEWTAEDELRGAEVAAATDRYIAGRSMKKLGEGMMKTAKEELRDVQGRLPDGRMVSWVRGGSTINVVETTAVAPAANAGVLAVAEQAQRELAEQEAAPAASAEDREKELKRKTVGELRTILGEYGLETKGLKAELVARTVEHEWPTVSVTTQVVMEDAEQADSTVILATDEEVREFGGVDFQKMLDELEAEEPTPTIADTLGAHVIEEIASAAPPKADMPTTIMVEDQPFQCSCGSRFFYQLAERTWDCTACGQRWGDALPEEPPTPAQPEVIAHMRKQQYEPTEVLRRRQALFGMLDQELSDLAAMYGCGASNRQTLIQLILDAEFQPVPGRGYQPAEDGRTERLQQMQHDTEAGLRQRLGQVSPEQVGKRIEGGA